MIDMSNIIPNTKLVELLETNGLFFCIAIFESEFVMTLKKLVICITSYMILIVDKTLIEGHDMDFKKFFG